MKVFAGVDVLFVSINGTHFRNKARPFWASLTAWCYDMGSRFIALGPVAISLRGSVAASLDITILSILAAM
jgi:hypothetical protein